MLIITGTMGAGKSAVLAEAADLLAQRRIIHAAIDVDALGLAHLPAATNNDVMYDNLRDVCANYAAQGVRRFLIARAVERNEELQRCRGIFPAANLVICRLTAGTETMRRRVAMRETGIQRAEYIARVDELCVLLDRAHLEDFALVNENRSVTDVALEMLVRAGWIAE